MPAGDPERLALGKFFAHLGDRAARLKALPERRHAARAQRFDLLAPQRDQFILFVHRIEAAGPAAASATECSRIP